MESQLPFRLSTRVTFVSLFAFFIRTHTTHNETVRIFLKAVEFELDSITENIFPFEINLKFYCPWDFKVIFLIFESFPGSLFRECNDSYTSRK